MNFSDIFLDTSEGNDKKDQDHERLTALVYDSDFFTENSSQFESYFGENGGRTGWSLILRGLIHPDSLAQKKSLYLLKRLVEHLKLDLNYFTNYFLVLETVDEKQAHIVKQISGHIKNLWSNYHLDYLPWNLILLRRLFSHQNQAIAKSALVQFMKHFEIHPTIFGKFCFHEFIQDSLLPSLNNPKFYDTNEIFDALKDYLLKMKKDGKAWSNFVHSVMEISWAPIPLFHCTRALQDVSKNTMVMEDFTIDLKKFEKFISWSMKCQEPLIRGAAQESVLRMLINISDSEKICPNDPNVEILNLFRGKSGILIRGTELQMDAFDWLKNNKTPESEVDYSNILPVQDVIKHPKTEKLLDDICAKSYRLYGPDIKEDILKLGILIQNLIQPKLRKGREHLESHVLIDGDFIDDDKKNLSFLRENNFRQTEIAEIILNTLNKHPEESMVNKKLDILKHFCGFNNFRGKYEDCLQKLSTSTLPEIKFLSYFIKELKVLDLSQLIREKKIPKIPTQDICPDGLTSSKHICCQWNILTKFLELMNFHEENDFSKNVDNESNEDNILIELFETAMENLQTGGIYAIEPILKAVAVLMKKMKTKDILHENDLTNFLQLAQSSVNDLRKNDLFWPAFNALVGVLFQPKFESDFLIHHFDKILEQSELVQGLALIMINRISENFEEFPDKFKIWCLAKCLTFGPIYKKDQILMNLTNEFIYSNKYNINYIEGSDHLVNTKVRSKGIELLLLLTKEQDSPKNDILKEFIDVLKSIEKIVVGNKTRYFENSNIHIIKQRTSQALLLLTSFINENTNKDILEILCEIALENIEAPSQQLSVRYMYEWLIMRLARTDKNFVIIPKIKKCLQNAKISRLGIVPAYLCILTHAVVSNDFDQKNIENIIDIIAPWCFGQHFMTRLCANSCFNKLLNKISNPPPSEKYLYMKKCIEDTLCQGDFQKNQEKFKSDFYLNDFDPDLNFNLCDIFHHIPRLMNVNDIIKDEIWTTASDFNGFSKNNLNSTLNKCRENFCLCISCFKYSTTGSSNTISEVSILNHEDESFEQVQKKITPWKKMFDIERESKRSSTHPDLIIVASLIDRAPNLGGLARTCEIFGAGKLVLNNKKILEDKDFLSTSVTAHQWIETIEVKIEGLKEYLEDAKSKGYKIIGIEQTSESTKLNEFQFPEKSVIFLGNEKEGIPVELIQLLDCCVEIPQHGIIRSLNVHVTGAIIIWEYVKQHLK